MTGDGKCLPYWHSDVSRIFLLLKGKLVEFSRGG